ncbi:MAG: transketolase [Ruminococcaceae bacterium]|nr:transketolase [Oscillospiraceae bacterium]
MDNKSLEIISYKIRKHAINAVYNAASGHPGGSLSIADILAVLYFDKMNITDPNDEMRDRFVLSKGHCSPALYGALAEKDFINKEDITTFRHIDSYLQGHPDMKNVPGVDMSTGSLGQGVSTACGMALNAKIDNKDYRVYAILGDGELEEGQVWEAAMFAPHYKLDNLTIFVDFNGLQIDGNISDVMSPLPIDKKFENFGWNVIVIDAHSYDEIKDAIEKAKMTKGKPTAIIAKSTKGKGVSFMENNAGWHGMAPNEEQYKIAISDLNKKLEELGAEIDG